MGEEPYLPGARPYIEHEIRKEVHIRQLYQDAYRSALVSLSYMHGAFDSRGFIIEGAIELLTHALNHVNTVSHWHGDQDITETKYVEVSDEWLAKANDFVKRFGNADRAGFASHRGEAEQS